MNDKNLEHLISKLGSSHQVLIAENLIPDTKLVKMYEDEDTLELEMAPGIELVFWAESLRLEMIHINFQRASTEDESHLSSLLPSPLSTLKNESDVHNVLGKAMFSKSERELMQTELYGWDTYQIDPSLHPEAILDIQYDKNRTICNMQISLIDKNI